MTDSLSSSIMSSRPPMSSKVTGISFGATTSIAMACSYCVNFNSFFVGRSSPKDKASSSSSSFWLCLLANIPSIFRVASSAFRWASARAGASVSRRERRVLTTQYARRDYIRISVEFRHFNGAKKQAPCLKKEASCVRRTVAAAKTTSVKS